MKTFYLCAAVLAMVMCGCSDEYHCRLSHSTTVCTGTEPRVTRQEWQIGDLSVLVLFPPEMVPPHGRATCFVDNPQKPFCTIDAYMPFPKELQ